MSIKSRHCAAKNLTSSLRFATIKSLKFPSNFASDLHGKGLLIQGVFLKVHGQDTFSETHAIAVFEIGEVRIQRDNC